MANVTDNAMANDAAAQFSSVVDELSARDKKQLHELGEELKADGVRSVAQVEQATAKAVDPMQAALEKSGVKLKLDGVAFAGDVGEKEVAAPQRNDEAVQFQQEKKAKAAEQGGGPGGH